MTNPTANPLAPSSDAPNAAMAAKLSRINTPPLRIVFMGTPALAARILERLVAEQGSEFAVVGVVTRPDQPRKRGLKLEPSEVGAVAARHALATLKPAKIRTAEFLTQLEAFAPDLLVVAAYGRILPNAVLAAPRLLPLNVHASLLPHHRGAAPIEGAILAGDHKSGVTIMRVTEQMDAGPILLQQSLELAADETQGSLKAKLAELGAAALIETLGLIRRGELIETPQDEALVTSTRPVTKQDAQIDWRAEAESIERMVRAYDPWPTARTVFCNEALLVWKTAIAPETTYAEAIAKPATLVELQPIPIVRCGTGILKLLEVQAPGRRRMSAAEFFRGRRATVGMSLGS
jgi:methionyl-tRNA formyltransferase